MTLVAGIDSSTQACKVVVRDADSGRLVREGRAPHPPGTEVDPAAWESALDTALAAAAVKAASHASGGTSVPGGCGARPLRTSSPLSASRTTTLQAWVEVSTPATRRRAPVIGAAGRTSRGGL